MFLLQALPSWTAYVMGALFLGLPGIAVAWPFRRRARLAFFYALLPAFTLSPLMSRELIMPWLRDVQITSIFNSYLPMKMDDHTTLTSGSLSQKRYIYQYELDAGARKETADQIKERQKLALCRHWVPQFKDGSAVSAQYRYKAPWGDLAYTVTMADCT